MEGLEVVFQRLFELLSLIDNLQLPIIDNDSHMLVCTVFDRIVKQVFDYKGEEFEIDLDNIILFDIDRDETFGMLDHKQIDTRFDQIAHLVGFDIEFKVLGSDLLYLGKLIDKQIETFEDTVQSLFALFIRQHLTHQTSLGNGRFELMHRRTQKELS